MDLNEIKVFVKVIQAGSFQKASELLGMPKSTVSAKVSALENRLGVTLIHRTTRKLNLTQVGEEFYNSSLKHIEGLVAAEEMATTNQGEPKGILRVTSPSVLAASILPEVISKYLDKYPLVDFELVSADHTVDLIGQNIDLAIRAGKLADSSLKTKKIGVASFGLYGSPTYLKGSKKITHPKDLLDHDCIQFLPFGKDQWEFTNKAKNKVTIAMKKKLMFNELNIVKELAVQARGVAILPTFVCERETQCKDLVRILPDWLSGTRDVSFVYPAHKYLPPKISHFIEMAGEHIKKKLDI